MLEADNYLIERKVRRRRKFIRNLNLVALLTCGTLTLGSSFSSCAYYKMAKKARYESVQKSKLEEAKNQRDIAETNGLLTFALGMGYLGYRYGKRK